MQMWQRCCWFWWRVHAYSSTTVNGKNHTL